MAQEKVQHPAVKVHDYLNLAILGCLTLWDIVYLYQTTDLRLLGTAHLGAATAYRASFAWLKSLFTLYIVLDSVWILFIPESILVLPAQVLAHHAATFLLLRIPAMDAQFDWHAAICISVELQTIILTLRRRVPVESTAYRLLDVAFYLFWGIYRLVLFPALVVFFWQEYLRYSKETGSYYNRVAMAAPLLSLLVVQGLIWTYQVLTKRLHVGPKRSA